MECMVDMSSKQRNEMNFGIQGRRIQVILPPEDLDVADHTQVKPYDGEKEGKVDPWKLWHWARSAPETWVGKKERHMKSAETAGELAPGFWSWPVIALLFTPADAPAHITHVDGQAPNLQAILACTCHCRPTEVYRGPERTLAETDPGATDFIMSHKNSMMPLKDLERGMGVSEEHMPYMKHYHGYMFGSDATHRGPVGAPVELPGAYNEALYPHITPRSDAAEKRNHELAAQYVAHIGDHDVLPKHLYSDEDYASIHASAKELRLAVDEVAARAAAGAASIPP
eukprot:jgi/Tetstr1/453193/TSEL_040210.t1